MTRLESYYEGGEISPRQTDGKTGNMMINQKTLSHLSYQAAAQKIKYHTPFQLFFFQMDRPKKNFVFTGRGENSRRGTTIHVYKNKWARGGRGGPPPEG